MAPDEQPDPTAAAAPADPPSEPAQPTPSESSQPDAPAQPDPPTVTDDAVVECPVCGRYLSSGLCAYCGYRA